MTGLMTRLEPYAYALMRSVAGLLFLFHGLQKLFGMFGRNAVPLMSQHGLAGVIELVGGALIMIGLAAAPAAFIASGLMAAAYFMAHAKGGFWPIVNKGELAVVYCFVFLYIATRGSGTLSVDRLRGKGGRR